MMFGDNLDPRSMDMLGIFARNMGGLGQRQRGPRQQFQMHPFAQNILQALGGDQRNQWLKEQGLSTPWKNAGEAAPEPMPMGAPGPSVIDALKSRYRHPTRPDGQKMVPMTRAGQRTIY